MPDTSICTKEHFSLEDCIKLFNIVQAENEMIQNNNVPDKFEVSQILVYWSNLTEDPVNDLLFVFERVRELIQMSMMKKQEDVDRICCEIIGRNF